jgi:hypothetical protein
LPEIRIGERMSYVSAPESYISLDGDLYESKSALATHKPLDTGRLLYAMLWRELADMPVKVEVVWNHFDNTITAIMEGEGFCYDHTFRDTPLPRAELLAYVKSIVDRAKELVCQQ